MASPLAPPPIPGFGSPTRGLNGARINSDCNLTFAYATPALPHTFCAACDGQEPFSSPTLAGGVAFWTDGNAGHTYASDPISGATLWTSSAGGSWVVGAPVVANGRVFVVRCFCCFCFFFFPRSLVFSCSRSATL